MMGSGSKRKLEWSDEGSSLPSASCLDGKKRKVTYFYDDQVDDFSYGETHPMKPHRVAVTHNLVSHYNLLKHPNLEIREPMKPSVDDICEFHSRSYIEYLADPLTTKDKGPALEPLLYNLGNCENLGNREPDDCPLFPGAYDFSRISAGGSIGAAVTLMDGDADIAINWTGGLHHAKKLGAFGFCIVNDIVLGIQQLLKKYQRVLYVDIDIHHGDGVEEAFSLSDRVMTISFHRFGPKKDKTMFFPGTGKITDVGKGPGKYYAVNVPLREGMDDESYQGLFRPIIKKAVDVYQPQAIVLQCGADSLSGDELGDFNLSTKGHADCVRYIRSLNIPLMLLGGGGYTVTNVARCWCYETAVALGVELENDMPYNHYYDYFAPDYQLHIQPCRKMKNMNSAEDLKRLRDTILSYLSQINSDPSAQFSAPDY